MAKHGAMQAAQVRKQETRDSNGVPLAIARCAGVVSFRVANTELSRIIH